MATYLLVNGVVIAEVVPGANSILYPGAIVGDFWKEVGLPPKPVDPDPEVIGYIPVIGSDGDFIS